jgi:MscS family membrane protein
MRWLLAALKQLLVDHPKIDPNPARVRFVNFGESTLDVEIFAYVLTNNVNEFQAIREELYLRIMDIVTEAGSGFAFPSQTAYNAMDTALDRERQKAVAAEVAKWKSKRPEAEEPATHIEEEDDDG